MSDLVERLRNLDPKLDPWAICDEAADEIERLRAALRSIENYEPGKTTEALLLRGYARSVLEPAK